jgi:hypothetical protein
MLLSIFVNNYLVFFLYLIINVSLHLEFLEFDVLRVAVLLGLDVAVVVAVGHVGAADVAFANGFWLGLAAPPIVGTLARPDRADPDLSPPAPAPAWDIFGRRQAGLDLAQQPEQAGPRQRGAVGVDLDLLHSFPCREFRPPARRPAAMPAGPAPPAPGRVSRPRSRRPRAAAGARRGCRRRRPAASAGR